jgi:hypothetical protein
MDGSKLLMGLVLLGFLSATSQTPATDKPKNKAAAARRVAKTATPTLPPKPVLQFDQFNPAGSRNDCGIYAEVESRTPNKPSYPDMATRCHEWTHLLNGRMTSYFDRPAFYVGGGRAVTLSKPRLSLPDVAPYVTQFSSQYRSRFVSGSIAASHVDDPLDILDEFSAYANDLQCQIENRMKWQGTDEQVGYHCCWADSLVKAVKARDPGYADLNKLVAFVDWQTRRASKLIAQAPREPQPQ